jgi:hypothetical protein
MIINYSVLIFIIGLSFSEGIYHKVETVSADSSRKLLMDEAYLILKNTNYSHNVALFGNKIICEACDLERIITVGPDGNATKIINTKYAYDLEVRSQSSNVSLLCQIASYKFAEHGTYVLDIEQITSVGGDCPIKQIGNPSNYLAPAILGIFFVVMYTIFVQLWPYLYRSKYVGYFRTNILHQPLANSAENMQQQAINVPTEDPLDKKTRNKRALPKRLRALDTFRGFSLMVMIFVNYGGMCSIFRFSTQKLKSRYIFYRWWLLVF